MKNSKPKWSEEFDARFVSKEPVKGGFCYILMESPPTVKAFIRKVESQAKAEGRKETAQQCYLEVLAVSGEENEYTEAIKTKFKL